MGLLLGVFLFCLLNFGLIKYNTGNKKRVCNGKMTLIEEKIPINS